MLCPSPRPSSTKTRIKTQSQVHSRWIHPCAPRPSSTKTRIKAYNSLDFCYEIVISKTILKIIAGGQEFGSMYQTFSSRQYILLSVCRLMSVQSAQVFFKYFQKHPNVSSEFSRVFRTNYEFFFPKLGIKKGLHPTHKALCCNPFQSMWPRRGSNPRPAD